MLHLFSRGDYYGVRLIWKSAGNVEAGRKASAACCELFLAMWIDIFYSGDDYCEPKAAYDLLQMKRMVMS